MKQRLPRLSTTMATPYTIHCSHPRLYTGHTTVHQQKVKYLSRTHHTELTTRIQHFVALDPFVPFDFPPYLTDTDGDLARGEDEAGQ